MRKIVSYLHASLDGLVEGRETWDLGWVRYDAALEGYAKEVLQTADTVLWGRVTFLGCGAIGGASLPADPESSAYELEHAAWLERTPKIVVSSTLSDVGWANTSLIRGDLTEEVRALKQQPGGDIVILGSPRLTHALTELALVDEYRVNVNPVVIGGVVPLFASGAGLNLGLLGQKVFDSGVVGLHYGVNSEGQTGLNIA